MKNGAIINVVFSFLVCCANVSCSKNNKPDTSSNADSGKNSLVETKTISNATTTLESDSLADKLKEVIKSKYLKPEDLKLLDSNDRKFSFQEIDLNDDGKKEVFINFFSPYFCGTGGCSLLLLDSDLNIITRFTVTETPIYISPETKNRWNVLMVKSRNAWKTLEFANGKYPSNPSVAKDSSSKPDPKSILVFKDPNDSKVYNF